MSAAETRRADPALLDNERRNANDSFDGLTESEEAARHAAEDIPGARSPTGKTDAVPVFDRTSLPPKV